MTIVAIIFYILLADALIAVLFSWSGGNEWWVGRLGAIGKHFPLTRGWTTLYLMLVLFIGWILHTHGELPLLW